MHTHLGTEGSLSKVFLIDFIPPQRNLPDLSSAEACKEWWHNCLPIPFLGSLKAKMLLKYTCRWNKFHKGTSGRGTCTECLCLCLASSYIPSPSTYEASLIWMLAIPMTQWVQGWDRRDGQKSPGVGDTCKCAGTPSPQRGSPARFTVLWDLFPPW